VQIVFRRAAERALDRRPAARRRQIVARIEQLATGPTSRNLDIRPLEGSSFGLFRLRVGDYRVLFSIDDVADTVTIELIRGRGDVYKR
jgi:mRNA interferase RelE/StbE